MKDPTESSGDTDLEHEDGADPVREDDEALLARCDKYRTAIYAWELINEPEWITRGGGGWLSPLHRIALDHMLQFIARGTSLIRGHGFRPSLGFASQRTQLRWEQRAARTQPAAGSAARISALGTELDQFHYYARFGRGPIPVAPATGRPTLLGEFGTRMPGARALSGLRCTRLSEDTWPDLTDQGIAPRLTRVRSLGYEAAFAWAYRSHDCRTAADRAAMLQAIAQAAGVTP